MTAQPAKICSVCGVDCADRPRVKDSQGRYVCRHCAETRSGTPDSGAIDLVPDLQAAPAIESVTPCPECGRPIPAGGAVCVSCGHSLATGKPVRTHTGKDELPPGKHAMDYRVAMPIDRVDPVKEYTKPLLMVLIGVGIVAAWQRFDANSGIAGLQYLTRYSIMTPIAIAVFVMCGLLWVGFEAPLLLSVVRIAGCYAIGDLVQHSVNELPLFGIVAWVMAIFVYMGLLTSMLDMDMQDAAAVSLFTFLAKWIVKNTLFASMFPVPGS